MGGVIAGTPKVGSTSLSIDAEMGIKVNPDDVDAISHAMVTMANNLDRYDGEKIRSKVVSRFGLKAFGEKLQDYYGELIGQCAELQE